MFCCWFFFFKQKTAYEIRPCDWSSDVCSSDLAAHGNRLPLLEHAQQLHLRRGGHLADLVQEEGATARRREQTLLVAHGARERALDVSEQLRLEQALGERPAVERQERAFGTRRALVNVAGDDLLPGSRLAPDQHRALRRRHLLGQPQHILKQPRLAERLHEPGTLAAPDLLLELLVLRLEAADLGRAPAQSHDLVVGERLRYVVERAL